jgi:hypothetical protein
MIPSKKTEIECTVMCVRCARHENFQNPTPGPNGGTSLYLPKGWMTAPGATNPVDLCTTLTQWNGVCPDCQRG